MLEKLNELFNIIDNPKVISENNETLKIELDKQHLDKISLIKLNKINDFQQFCKLFSVTVKGKVNRYLKEKFIGNSITDSDYSQIEKVELIIDKNKLYLNKYEVYFYDLENFMKIPLKFDDVIKIVYNNTLSMNGPINFININDVNSVSVNEISDNDFTIYDYRHFTKNYNIDHPMKKKVISYMDYVVITSTLLYISEQHEYNNGIKLNGEKEIQISNYFYEDCLLNEFERSDLKKINLLIKDDDPNIRDKIYMIKKIISLYLPDSSYVKDFISKLNKIYPKFADTVDNYIDNKVENYFENHNKLIEEVIKSSNKITEETNKSITQILTLLTTLLASLFVYFYKSKEINSTLFLSLVIFFLIVSSVVIIYNHISNFNYYTRFIDNYFDVINSIYHFKASEKSIRKKLLEPSIKRYEKTINQFIILVSILTFIIFITLIINIYGINSILENILNLLIKFSIYIFN